MKWTVVAMLVVGACSSDKEKPSPAKEAAKEAPPPNVFSCLKISKGSGRTCAGPGYIPGTDGDDVFETREAWCLTQRVSWTNAHSKMRCVPTQEECQRDLMTTPAGKQNILVRTDCTRTIPDGWTHKESDYSRRDGFECKQEEDFRAEKKGATISRCNVFPADMTEPTVVLEPEAWCYEGPRKGEMFNLRCFGKIDECQGRSEDLGKCSLMTAQQAIAIAYGGLEKD